MIEADAPCLFTAAFLFVTVFFVATIFVLYKKKRIVKRTSVILFLLHWVFITLAFFGIMEAFRPDWNFGAMQTENLTVLVGWSGVCWAISVGFLVAGLVNVLNRDGRTD